jgi:hypothetical protein
MIRFSLKCSEDHHFESWFQSGSAFDKVKAAGLVSCPTCGTTVVDKTLMAPPVRTARAAVPRDETQPNAETSETATQIATAQTEVAPSAPQPSSEDVAHKIAELKAHVEATSDYVGKDFAKEARAMHGGETPERSIYGEANLTEAKALIEEGIPLAPLPFIPARKVN